MHQVYLFLWTYQPSLYSINRYGITLHTFSNVVWYWGVWFNCWYFNCMMSFWIYCCWPKCLRCWFNCWKCRWMREWWYSIIACCGMWWKWFSIYLCVALSLLLNNRHMVDLVEIYGMFQSILKENFLVNRNIRFWENNSLCVILVERLRIQF